MRIRNRASGLKMRNRISVLSWSLAAGAALVATVAYDAQAEDQLRLQGEAPKNQRIVGHTPGGYYYAAKPLKDEYDKLLDRVYALRLEIIGGKISSKEAAGTAPSRQQQRCLHLRCASLLAE